jgi:hypothetical protein
MNFGWMPTIHALKEREAFKGAAKAYLAYGWMHQTACRSAPFKTRGVGLRRVPSDTDEVRAPLTACTQSYVGVLDNSEQARHSAVVS